MKKFCLYILLPLIFFMSSDIIFAQNKTDSKTSEIPYFTFYTLDSQRFTKDSFDDTRLKFIMYFNSECDHCQKQAKWLSKEIESFSHLEMVFVSFEEMDAIKGFKKHYNFTQKNITFLQDTRLTFADKFKVESFPSILIYSKEGKLLRKYEGQTKVSDLLKFMPTQ